MRRRHLLALAAAAGGGGQAAPTLLRAQGGMGSWPDRIVVPFPPGGSTDTIARIVQPKLSELLGGKPIVIDNRSGVSGSIGAVEAARAAQGSTTWFLAYHSEATNQTVMRLPYRTLGAFAPVSLVATGPPCLVAHKDTPFQSFEELAAAAKAAPDTLGYATGGVGGLAHVSTTLPQQQGGFRLVHVPYRAAGWPCRIRWRGRCRSSCRTS
jgi:tripartite-type tricarboxylate transporter receptor subunit TctC